MTGIKRRRTRGSALVELAFVMTPSFLLMVWVIVVGLQLGHNVRAAQVTRDAASMFVRGVDFSKTGNQDILVRLASGMGMTRAGGQGVVILTRVTWISAATCASSGLNPCNSDRHVITQRLVIGNSSLRTSSLGTPVGVDSMGIVGNYMQDSRNVATFPYMQLASGEYAYVAEGYFDAPQWRFPGFNNAAGAYSIALF
ncbi:MAG: hypothetical protein IT161_20090 [Bryobacterales bacterium]|nr:hypothetical protein [Bryobacterales bacterium]